MPHGKCHGMRVDITAKNSSSTTEEEHDTLPSRSFAAPTWVYGPRTAHPPTPPRGFGCASAAIHLATTVVAGIGYAKRQYWTEPCLTLLADQLVKRVVMMLYPVCPPLFQPLPLVPLPAAHLPCERLQVGLVSAELLKECLQPLLAGGVQQGRHGARFGPAGSVKWDSH